MSLDRKSDSALKVISYWESGEEGKESNMLSGGWSGGAKVGVWGGVGGGWLFKDAAGVVYCLVRSYKLLSPDLCLCVLLWLPDQMLQYSRHI